MKIVLAKRTVERALDTRVPAEWVNGDAAYGSGYGFREAIEDRGLGYMPGVRTHPSGAGGRGPSVRRARHDRAVDARPSAALPTAMAG